MHLESRIPLTHWASAIVLAVVLHLAALAMLESSSSSRALAGPTSGPTASRLRLSLGAARLAVPDLPATPATRPARPPSAVTRTTPAPTPRPSSSADPADSKTATLANARAAAANASAGLTIPEIDASVGSVGAPDSLGAGGQNGSSIDGRAQADYFDAVFAQVLFALDYPRRARLEEIEGTVVLELHIDRDGHIDDLRVAESSGSTLLDRHALKIARRAAPFGPVPTAVDPEELRFELPLEFALTD